jgi:hypothetical protein
MTCFERTASPAVLESFRSFRKNLRSGRCKYCGAPAVGGTGGLSIPGVMDQQLNLWCEQCRLDLVEFARQPENAIPEWPFDDEAAQERISQQMADHERRLQEFMRHKIKERSQ